MEADDLIATLTKRAEERSLDVVIVTADKDARQLIGDHVRVLNLRKNKLMDADVLKAEWGIRPDQVVDFLALTGDSVDNVPGVPGIGEGFAASFLAEFGTLDSLLAHVDRVKGPKKQQSLRENAETARPARRLVTLRDDIPLPLDWEKLRTQEPDAEALKALCTECGFHRFRDELVTMLGPATPPHSQWQASYRTVDTPELLDQFLGELAPAQVLRQHRDDGARSAARRPRGPGILLESRRGLLPAAARADLVQAAGSGCVARCFAPDTVRHRMSRRSARTSSTICWR